MGGVILLQWSGTCSLQLAGNSGQGANLYGFRLFVAAPAHKQIYFSLLLNLKTMICGKSSHPQKIAIKANS